MLGVTSLLSGTWAALLLGQCAQAAQCCGNRGDSFDEPKLWGLRAILCNDPLAQTNSAGGHLVETSLSLGHIGVTYGFWARSLVDSQSFKHCWGATQNLIEQCSRSGQAAGSWEYEGELYAMTATAGFMYNRRDNFSVTDLPSLPASRFGTIQDIMLENSTYNILGVPVRLSVTGIDLSPASRITRRTRALSVIRADEDSQLSDATIITQPAISMASIVHSTVSELLGQTANASAEQNSLSRRMQTCQASKRYVMVEYGKVDGRPIPHGVLIGTGHSKYRTPVTFTERLSTDIEPSLRDAIAGAAHSLGYSWERSHTTQDLGGCRWTEGACHTDSIVQPAVYQMGFILDAQLLPSWDSSGQPPLSVDIKLVRSEAPDGNATLNCDISCCSLAFEKRYSRLWDGCQYAARKECYYGTCKDWDEDCNSVGQVC